MEIFLQHLREFAEYSPKDLYHLLEQQGYIGQERAKKALCLMAYRHLNRLRKQYLLQIPRSLLPPKENYLLIGPTGSGKTFLIELLFGKILQIPSVIVDITNFSETGYVGQDVNTILTRLIHAAHGNPELAECGIVCLDEFDKIASGQNSAVFSGAGTTKDVTGMGVQRELLKMLESSEVDVPMEISHSSYGDRITFNTANVSFIACGAFSGFREVLRSRSLNIGFGKQDSATFSGAGGIAVSLEREEVEKAANFEAYGLMPELIGRFARIIPFEALSKEQLRTILEKNTIRQYQTELGLDDIKLKVEDEVFDLIVEKCQARETGARGLKSYIVEYLEEACFEAYSSPKNKIRLYRQDDEVAWELQ